LHCNETTQLPVFGDACEKGLKASLEKLKACSESLTSSLSLTTAAQLYTLRDHTVIFVFRRRCVFQKYLWKIFERT